MNSEQNQRQCAACAEPESSVIIHTVSKNGVLRRLCTDCLLKEHRELFCPFCLNVFVDVPPPHGRIICGKCPSITHLACSPPPPPSSSSSADSCFTCPPCSDPNFSFFPKSRVPSSDQSGENVGKGGSRIKSAKALVAAAEIAVVSLNNAAALLREDAMKKIVDAQVAKKKAKEALTNLQDLVIRQKASENSKPPTSKRKNDER